MEINTYLNNLLEGSGEYAFTPQDIEIIDEKGLQEFILAKLYSKKFRKWKLSEKCKKIVESEVDSALNEDRPIRVFFAQGSYKLWQVSSAPVSNWAEFFNVSYLISYLAPIAAAYKNGVELTYYFLTVLPQLHNNLSQKEVSAYLESFERLINEFKKYLPANIKVSIEKDLDVYSTRSRYDEELTKAMVEAQEYFYKWSLEKQSDYLRRAMLNIKWNGVENWDELSAKSKSQKIERAVLCEYAATQIILEKDKLGRGVILSTLPKDDSIGVGSTSTSIAKHWVGEGVLEENNGTYYPRILSPSQYEYAKTLQHTSVNVEVVKGADKAFSLIDVFPNHFDFSQK
jgi:hypothetical protein